MAEFLSKYSGILIVAGLIGFYILTYYFNKMTPVPEECLDALDEASCNGCKNFACTHKK